MGGEGGRRNGSGGAMRSRMERGKEGPTIKLNEVA